MDIKFSFGPNTSIPNAFENINFFYISTQKDGISDKDNTGCPQKISSSNIEKILENFPGSIIGLFNFEAFKNNDINITKNAQGISNAGSDLYSMSIYKKEIWYDRENNQEKEQEIWTPVTFGSSSNILRDFNIANNRQYKYVFRLVKNKISGMQENTGGIIVPIKTNWMGWSITELHPTEDSKIFYASPKDVWKFKYNISTGAQTQNISKTQQDTLSAFPVFSHGVKNSVSGSVECLLGREIINANYTNEEYVYEFDNLLQQWTWRARNGNIKNLGGYKESLGRHENSCNGQYLSPTSLGFRDLSSNEAVDMLNLWREVCYSGNPKLLKDQKGQKFIIQITDPSNTVNDTWEKMPDSISFSWNEIIDSDDIKIVQESNK
jgi:hypothetical protein